ncbi:MAG: 2-oxo acid dehydrogenase subunit E2 [Chloroflexi bacterium]|nr:2-oxo acid dehydrogenase subunit E2 [Chloroflexota bacterium]
MPALELAQETGKVLRWLKAEGTLVTKGEPIMEIETDKVTVEIQAPASGTLARIAAREGNVVPVGQTVAWILAPGESTATALPPFEPTETSPKSPEFVASPVARQIAKEHGIDLALVKPGGGRIDKSDVLAYLDTTPTRVPAPVARESDAKVPVQVPVSPKARRLAAERGVDITTLQGSGPEGAVLCADVISAPLTLAEPSSPTLPTIWRLMVERMRQSWTTVPHFYLTREIAASELAELRARIAPAVEKRNGVKPTYSDLLVKIVAVVLRDHPRVNASWINGNIRWSDAINVGLATAVEDGLVVPVIHGADGLSIGEIAARRKDLVKRANAGKLGPADITGGTFTVTNLGMYNVDAFNAIINAPQAAILAIGRIAERVVAVNGKPAVQPMMTVTLSADHRVADGARAAKFLDDLANLIQEPWSILA